MRLLEKQGHTVVTVAQPAVRRSRHASARRSTLVLMDVQMPEMDGLEATAAHPRPANARPGGHMPIVAMTAHAMKGDRERCLDAGMDGYVAKPIRARELYERLARLVQLRMEDRGSRIEEVSGPSSILDPRSSELEPPFNLTRALRLADGDETLMHELFEVFLRELPQWRADLQAAVAARDARRIGHAVHPIRGAGEYRGQPR